VPFSLSAVAITPNGTTLIHALLIPVALLAALGSGFYSQPARAAHAALIPEFASCEPESDDLDVLRDGMGRPLESGASLSADFCSQWNPEFGYNGFRCCSTVLRAKVRRRRRMPPKTCSSAHFKPGFCSDILPEQREYIDAVTSGKIPDALALITQEMGRKGDQAYCTVGNGFLANGRPVVPTLINHIRLNSNDRCANFGTDGMVGMLEWLGREIGREYSDPKYAGTHLIVGDIAAPRGGCLSGRNGPRGHASHTNGQDADIGFLTARAGRESPSVFHTDFDAKANWWLIKQILSNPYACVKVMFLDKKHIRKLGRAAHGDPDWYKYARFIRHIPYHKNHIHVRIGEGPGQPGCIAGANPEDEDEEIEGSEEAVDLEALDLKIHGPKPASTSSR
jgi:murein endopeptidase